MRTKWEILTARVEALRAELEASEHRLEALENTPCHLTCGRCGAEHETEADFAKHYIIPDERYLNLGYCPNGDTVSRGVVTMSEEIRWTGRMGY